ncbi:tripartite tricarboxylate transporter TctB family protein [Pseudooceanicola algae]|uniref:DUF1468 domain-containing protein n=1 Tax=Pseudooceanicola algae TaxID=1537215 RepID=A0A418SB36_9RHOB|nr:tripartite tricarboxylate transporter TctB family protein [Pseudooceanicola algae]QPM91329.1 hypothetical protein PSAL_025820 [Pseudooceanicola algae]
MTTGERDQNERPRAWWGAAGGAALIGLSVYFMWGGLALGLGSVFRPGTGAFPFFTGLLLIVLGVGIVLQDLGRDGLAERPDWVSFAAISAALAVFALLADRAGLMPAVFVATITASIPDRSLSLPGKALLGAILAVAAWGLFIAALGLPFHAVRGL